MRLRCRNTRDGMMSAHSKVDVQRGHISHVRYVVLFVFAVVVLIISATVLCLLLGNSCPFTPLLHSKQSSVRMVKPRRVMSEKERREQAYKLCKQTYMTGMFGENQVNRQKKKLENQARTLLAHMKLEDKVAQMIMVRPEAMLYGSGVATDFSPLMQQSFDRIPFGGVMYGVENIQSPSQTQSMIANLQSHSKMRIGLPAFVAVDEEGGSVARVSFNPAMGVEKSPHMRDVGASKNPQWSYRIGKSIGTYLHKFGFNVDFAPVADVLTNPNNELIKKRSFGEDPQLVSCMAAALSKGLQESQVFATYKHFPGHGSTSTDSHQGTTISQRTKQELMATDLVPFATASKVGVQFMMVSHVSYPQIAGDNTPASLSKKILHDIAREELGYQGILISDSMGMGAITNNYTVANAAVIGVQAGLDMLLCPQNAMVAHAAIVGAVRNGTISQQRIDESVQRIIITKLMLEKQ